MPSEAITLNPQAGLGQDTASGLEMLLANHLDAQLDCNDGKLYSLGEVLELSGQAHA